MPPSFEVEVEAGRQSDDNGSKCTPKTLYVSSGAALLGFAMLACLILQSWRWSPPLQLSKPLLPLLSPGGEPLSQTAAANGTLMVLTMTLAQDFEPLDRRALRALGSVTQTFSEAMRREFRSPAAEGADEKAGMSKILVVNECIPDPESPEMKREVAERIDAMRAQFGGEWNFEVYQKTSACGHAGTMNIVLDRLHDFEYWLHWDEAWFVDPSFVLEFDMAQFWGVAYAIMREHPEVGQLQFQNGGPDCEDWTTPICFGLHPITERMKEKLPELRGDMSRFWHHVNRGGPDWRDDWLPFSLHPGLNRASQALRAGYFDNDARKSATLYEQEYCMKWSYGTGGPWPPQQGYGLERAFVASFGPYLRQFAIRGPALPLRSPGGAPASQAADAKGTLMVVTMFLSRDFELRERYAKRVLGSVTSTFTDAMLRQFRSPSAASADDEAGTSKILVVNECIPTSVDPALRSKVTERLDAMKAQYGGELNLEIYQKVSNCGQAGSLNTVLDRIQGFEYWLHWEESWFVHPSFADKATATKYWDLAYDMLRQHPEVGQLAFHHEGPQCEDWATVECMKLMPVTDRFKEKLPRLNLDMSRFWNHVNTGEHWRDDWLPFSLRPALNRVSHALSAGYFDMDPQKRAVLFEQEWAMKWSYGTGGAWPPPQGYRVEKAYVGNFGPHDRLFVARDADHLHTYRRRLMASAVAWASRALAR